MKIKITVSNNLILLANIMKNHGQQFYVVGGFLRNYLLNIFDSLNDIDICGTMGINQLEDIAKEEGFGFSVVNKRLGTCKLSVNGQVFEYTRLRQEKYDDTGSHTPKNVNFTNDIAIDASRRDFTINALYYDPLTEELYDFYNGLSDIASKTLRCVETPMHVFKDDGLRILRLIRFATHLKLNIDKNTLNYAKKYAYNLQDISTERVIAELKQIFNNKHKYYKDNKILKSLWLIEKLNITNNILPKRFNNLKLSKHKRLWRALNNINSGYDYFYYLVSILLMSVKLKNLNNAYLEFLSNQLLGTQGLNESNDVKINTTKFFIYFYNFNTQKPSNQMAVLYDNLSESDKQFLLIFNKSKSKRMIKKVNILRQLGVAFNLSEINFKNADFLNLNVNPKYINNLKTIIFNEIIWLKLKNDYESIKNYLIMKDDIFLK